MWTTERMEIDECPLPEVAAALGPFIKPRNEVSAIRRNLQAYLEKQLPGEDETPLSTVNLVIPADETIQDPPSGLTGVRKAYWKALQADQTAQANYDSLKADLEALKRTPPPPDASETSTNDTYIPLLRQKENLRRLQVLERAYSSLPALPSGPLEDHLGAQPTPPTTTAPSSTTPKTSPEVEAKSLALKKALLKTQRRVQDRETRNAVAAASLPPDEELPNGAKIAGLQAALQELTVWMEEMLGMIADAEAENTAPTSVPPTPGAPPSGRKVDLAEIEASYDRYIHARRRLTHALSPLADSDETDTDDGAPLFPPANHSATTRSNKPSPAELLLPYTPHLPSLKSSEADLLQQKAFLRRQLTASEAETTTVVRRLAGESHLVQPGASRGVEWLEAAIEAEGETGMVVTGRVGFGEEWGRKALETLAGMQGVV